MMYNIPTIVKWAGGKKQLLKQFEPLFPKKIDRYFDPFVGGGAVALYILKYRRPKEVYLSDINEELINCYIIVRDHVDQLIIELRGYKSRHNEKEYYRVRDDLDPRALPPIDRAARFIYLNKTCFNGLYRVNARGKFNVPIGNYKNPAICADEDLKEASKLLQNAKINPKPTQFYDAVKDAGKGDFVYFDPPYYPLTTTSSFTSYTNDSFLDKEQEKLRGVFADLDKKKCNVMLSNSDTPYIEKLYENYKEHTIKVKATRMINCIAEKRGEINELVITNY